MTAENSVLHQARYVQSTWPLLTCTFACRQITLHVAYVHAFVNPSLFLVLHRGLRSAALDLCCGCCISFNHWLTQMPLEEGEGESVPSPAVNLLLPPPPPVKPPPPSLTLVNHCFMWVNVLFVPHALLHDSSSSPTLGRMKGFIDHVWKFDERKDEKMKRSKTQNSTRKR